jgi:hypothetical protein
VARRLSFLVLLVLCALPLIGQSNAAPVPVVANREAQRSGLESNVYVEAVILRAVAVLCVLTAHLLHFCTGVHTTFQRHLGQLGVIVFFVHTSLVLMFSLERSKLQGQALFFSF